MPLSRKKHFIFDMDGTLTIAVHDFQYMCKALGLPAETAILETINACPENERVDLMQKLYDLEVGYAEEAIQQEGAEALLTTLFESGHSLGILTRNSVELAHITLKACGLDKFFEKSAILGRESAIPKPDPEGIYNLLDHWNADKNDAVMIGDFKFDLAAGRAAGITTVHIAPDEQFLWPELTDLAYSHLDQIRQALGQTG